MVEAGAPLTVQTFNDTYRQLLGDYFGPGVRWTTTAWNASGSRTSTAPFYVYNYATGLSAAIGLGRRVLTGGAEELADDFGFLQGGCSKDPLDLLRDAGVDMEQPQPVDTALARFETLVAELDALL